MASADGPIRAAFTQADELAQVEQQAQKAATSALAAAIDRLMGRATGAATLSPEAYRAVLEPLQRAFQEAMRHASAAVQRFVPDAFRMGLQHAADQVGLELPLDVIPPPVQDDTARLLDVQLMAARTLLRSNDDIVPALAVAKRAVSRVNASITWQVNRAAAEGVQQTADQFGLSRRWVAERDACLHCLAYQGEVAGPGEQFAPPRRVFADREFTDDPIPNPPLHPHCRCVIQVHSVADREIITALRREARRSVAKGWSLPSESNGERLRAADKLLRRGAGLPKTVEEEASRAVKRGEFRSRNVPSGR